MYINDPHSTPASSSLLTKWPAFDSILQDTFIYIDAISIKFIYKLMRPAILLLLQKGAPHP